MLTTFDPNVGGSNAGGNLKMQMTSGSIYLLCLLLLLVRIESFIYFLTRNLPLLIFLLIPFFSIFWSISPETTLRRGVALLGTSIFGFYLAFAFSPKQILRAMASIYTLIAVSSFFFILVLPNYGTHQAGEYAGVWRGLFAQKNELGAAMALGLMTLLFCPVESRFELFMRRASIILCLFLLIMSESRAAWLSFTVAILIALPIHHLSGRGTRSALKAFSYILVVATTSGLALYHSAQILEALGKDPTLTGRTGVWELTLDRAMMRPILGYGYRAYWIEDNKLRLASTENWSDGIGHAHNTYIDMIAEIGLLGFVSFCLILSLVIIRMAIRIARRRDYVNVWSISLLTFILLRGFAESTMLQHADMNWVMFIYLFALIRELSRRESPRQKAVLPWLPQPSRAAEHQ